VKVAGAAARWRPPPLGSQYRVSLDDPFMCALQDPVAKSHSYVARYRSGHPVPTPWQPSERRAGVADRRHQERLRREVADHRSDVPQHEHAHQRVPHVEPDRDRPAEERRHPRLIRRQASRRQRCHVRPFWPPGSVRSTAARPGMLERVTIGRLGAIRAVCVRLRSERCRYVLHRDLAQRPDHLENQGLELAEHAVQPPAVES